MPSHFARRVVEFPLLAALLCSLLLTVEGSDHTKFQGMTTVHYAPQQYLPERTAGGRGRRLEAASQTCEQVATGDAHEGPIRIGYELLRMDDVPEEFQTYVSHVMNNASAYFAKILHVRQAQAPLFVDYPSDKYYPEDPVPFISPNAAKPTCGPDRVVIPDNYFRPTVACNYVFPAWDCEDCGAPDPSGKCSCDADEWNAQKADYCCKINGHPDVVGCDPNTFDPDIVEARARQNGFAAYPVCRKQCVKLPSGNGVEGKDLFVFVTIEDTLTCQGSEALLAYATHCATDQCDRPVFGAINFCRKKLNTGHVHVAYDVATAVHELSHVLGFSAPLFPYFRTPKGEPRVPRRPDNPNKFQNEIKFKCQNNVIEAWNSTDDAAPHRFVDLTGPGVVAYFDERGFSSCGCPTSKTSLVDGKCLWKDVGGLHVPSCVTKLITPMVKEKVREHFACYELEGAELENQDTSTCSVYASHWESRLFNGEIMAAAHSENGFGFISQVTLALFQDSGWYNVQWDMADNLIRNINWGYQKGCGFAMKDRCIVKGASTETTHFCTNVDTSACAPDRLSAKRCSLGAYAFDGTIPSVFDYFGGKSQFGTNPLMDYCPTFEVQHTNRICVNSDSDPRSNPASVQREVFGASSRCFIGDFHEELYNEQGIQDHPLCYATKCSEDGLKYEIGVGDGKGGVDWLDTCFRSGVEVRKLGFGGRIVCAHPFEICGMRVPRYLEGLPMNLIEAAMHVKGNLVAPGESSYTGQKSDSAMKDASGRTAPAPAVFAYVLLSVTLASRGPFRLLL